MDQMLRPLRISLVLEDQIFKALRIGLYITKTMQFFKDVLKNARTVPRNLEDHTSESHLGVASGEVHTIHSWARLMLPKLLAARLCQALQPTTLEASDSD